MATCTEELEEQSKWVLKPEHRGAEKNFRQLVENEFLPPNLQLQKQEEQFSNIIRYAFEKIPYYRDLFSQKGLQLHDIGTFPDLCRIPLLPKSAILEQPKRFYPQSLPPGEKLGGFSSSSGTSGKDMHAARSVRSKLNEIAMLQRQHRWFRFDPLAKSAWIRASFDLLVPPHDTPLPLGKTLSKSEWPNLGIFFVTGPYVAFGFENTLEQKVEWLQRQNPSYLRAMSAELESLAFAFQDQPRLPNMGGMRATGEVLTEGMRQRIEKTLGAPVNISYGLNELGWIAIRCPEGGRYHVNAECCLVELIRDDGSPCSPGEIGSVLITMFDNAAMPFIRYDTGDLAMAVDGACPCGRTLPAIGDIIGRRSERLTVPGNIIRLADELRRIVEYLPAELSGCLRTYQIYQDCSSDFTLRLVTADSIPEGLQVHIKKKWAAALTSYPLEVNYQPALQILRVDQIPKAVSGKHPYFISDFEAA